MAKQSRGRSLIERIIGNVLNIEPPVNLESTLDVAGDADVGGDLGVTGDVTAATFNGSPLGQAAAVDYATTEHALGEKWTGGETIYRKVIAIAAGPNNETLTAAHGITGLDTVIRLYGQLTDGSGNARSLPHVDTSDPDVANLGIGLAANATNIILTSGADFSLSSGWVIIEYLKTA